MMRDNRENWRDVLAGNLKNDSLTDDLFYSINPYTSDAANAFLLEVVEKFRPEKGAGMWVPA